MPSSSSYMVFKIQERSFGVTLILKFQALHLNINALIAINYSDIDD